LKFILDKQDGVQWTGTICLFYWRVVVNMVVNLRFPYNSGHFLSSFANGGFSRTQLHGVKEL
jgi:hypothetical protein